MTDDLAVPDSDGPTRPGGGEQRPIGAAGEGEGPGPGGSRWTPSPVRAVELGRQPGPPSPLWLVPPRTAVPPKQPLVMQADLDRLVNSTCEMADAFVLLGADLIGRTAKVLQAPARLGVGALRSALSVTGLTGRA